MTALAAVAMLTSAYVVPLGVRHVPSRTSRGPMAVVHSPQPTEQTERPEDFLSWRALSSGIKFVDEAVGSGAPVASDSVISLHYSVSTSSGMPLGSSRGKWPLTFAPGKHNVPIFSEAVEGMRVGGRRRLNVPAGSIPPSQLSNVPQDVAGESLRFEVELVGIETGLKALIPSLLPPGNRRVTIARVIFFLSFLPYFLPQDLKPELWRAGDVQAIRASHQAEAWDARTAEFLGGASVEELFP